MNYPSSLASLFATIARQAPTHTCGWCMESGEGHLIVIGSRMVLDSHPGCMTNAGEKQCLCLDPLHPGDNPDCPKHGVKK